MINVHELPPPDSITHLIQTEMKKSMMLQVNRYRRKNQGHIPQDASDLIQQAIVNKCSESSADTLILLGFNYPDKFEHLFLVGSYVQDKWDRHVVFAAQDTRLQWYYGSPSEILPAWYNGPADTYQEQILRSPYPKVGQAGSIEALMWVIQQEQPGQWPDAHQVQHLLNRQVHLPYQISDYSPMVCLTEIQYLQGGVQAIQRKVTIQPDMIPLLGQHVCINPNIGYGSGTTYD